MNISLARRQLKAKLGLISEIPGLSTWDAEGMTSDAVGVFSHVSNALLAAEVDPDGKNASRKLARAMGVNKYDLQRKLQIAAIPADRRQYYLDLLAEEELANEMGVPMPEGEAPVETPMQAVLDTLQAIRAELDELKEKVE